MRSSAHQRRRDGYRDTAPQTVGVEVGEVRADLEQPSIELVHDQQATFEERLELARRRAAIEKRNKRIEKQQFWLRRQQELAREVITREEEKKRKQQRRYNEGRTEYERKVDERVSSAQRRFAEQQLERDRLAVTRTFAEKKGTQGGLVHGVKRYFERRAIQKRVPEADPTEGQQLADYLEYKFGSVWTVTIPEKDFELSRGDFVLKYQTKSDYSVSPKELGDFYKKWHTGDRTDTAFEAGKPYIYTIAEKARIADFAEDVSQAADKLEMLSLMRVDYANYMLTEDHSHPHKRELVALCNSFDGRMDTIAELVDHIPAAERITVKEALRAFSDPAVFAVLDDPAARTDFFAFMERFNAEASIALLPIYVAVYGDQSLQVLVDRYSDVSSYSGRPNNAAAGLVALKEQGHLPALQRRIYAGFSTSSGFRYSLYQLGTERIQYGAEGVQEQAAQVRGYDIEGGVADLLENDALLELSHLLITNFGYKFKEQEDVQILQSFAGIEGVVTAVATACASYSLDEPLIGTFGELAAILADSEQVEWLLDPDYSNFCRRLQGFSGLQIDYRASTII